MTKKQPKKTLDVEETQEVNPDLEQARKEAEEFKNLYLRTLADYKNLEHRVSQERQRMQIIIKKQIIFELLPVLDNLDQAEVFTKDPGLQMIGASFRKAVESMGVSQVDLVGTMYDPELAEAVEVVSGDDDDKVVEMVQKAYALEGQIIRPGKVKVSKKQS